MMDVIRNIFENGDINSQQKLILMFFASWNEKNNHAPSLEVISKQTKLSRSTIIRMIEGLKMLGFLIVNNPIDTGKRKVIFYRLNPILFGTSVSETLDDDITNLSETLEPRETFENSVDKFRTSVSEKHDAANTSITVNLASVSEKLVTPGKDIYNNVDHDQIRNINIDQYDQEKKINLQKAEQLSRNIHYATLSKKQNLNNSPKEMDTVLSELKGRGVIPSSKFTCVPNSDISQDSSILENLIFMGVSRKEANRWRQILGDEKLFYLKGNFDEWRKKNPFPIRRQPGAIFRGWVVEAIAKQNEQLPPRAQKVAYSAMY